MIERLEVASGPGTVIRFGGVVAWVSSSASPALISFLSQSARNLGPSPVGGEQLADHLADLLRERDPEPQVPFAAIGPSRDGWAALLHGPVQVWDGVRWQSAEPRPGWLRCELSPRPSLAVTVGGAPIPSTSPDSIWDLEAGIVPGGGFLLLPAVRAAPAGPGVVEVVAPRSIAEAVPAGGAAGGGAGSGAGGVGAEAGGAVAVEPRPDGALDLRSAQLRDRIVPYPPLPSGDRPERSVPGAPVVAGVLCPRGHMNRPGTPACVRCGAGIPAEGSYSVSGTRPALGCLIADDGKIYRLDRAYLVGSSPERDPTVRGGMALPLVLAGKDVAASHAELKLHEWDVVLTDRSSPGGTCVYEPDSTDWERLRAYEPRVLKPGTHVAFAQRVVTFVSPWVPEPPDG